MIFKTLGLLDLLTVIILAGAAIFPQKILVYAALYMLTKGLFFVFLSNDFASYGDAIAGGYMLLIVFGLTMPMLTTIALIYLGQKTFFTFVKVSIETYALYKFIRNSNGRSYESAYFYMR